ncbi:GNAT family N-acetyltransferase [Xylanimonas oleitrophica]|uniref:GNAT family N-acetyltransferase n=1 Tax=Xylanimonas oleitrophica TaxID=2607479 RepID=A0A2W5WZB7_9MICO|nr:GNAT family N-acetyltransferase [Xylanimonas oleitrophica]PZR53726.1 GNAT family N-acetyltransferase [Xylanimonas oleitrophica]
MSPPGDSALRFRAANDAPFEDLQAVLGASTAGRCQCQRIVLGDRDWWDMPVAERRLRLHEQTNPDDPGAASTSGVIAYLDGEPVGWVAVAPRTTYRRYTGPRSSSVPWQGRHEDRADGSVWAIVCFVVRKGCRGQGMTYELARAAVDLARERGAAAVEGYPIVAPPGQEITWDEASVGTPQVFAAAGLEEVGAPTVRRRVYRVDF